MKFDFYLSEMSVSDRHGGGLTLQRVIGGDLDKIENFIHVNRFATDLPAKGEFLKRSTNLLSFWEGDLVRKAIGRSRAAKLSKNITLVKKQASAAAKMINALYNGQQELTGLICPQGVNAIFTLEALKKRRQVKYITWIMDDHLVHFDGKHWQYPPGTERVFSKHLIDASHVFVISPAMQQFYKERFGIESTVLFGSSETTGAPGKVTEKSRAGLRIGYFGALAAWQKDALQAVVRTLPGTDTYLDIYSPIDKLPPELNVANVHFKGSITPEQVLLQMRAYDSLLLPISFQQKIRNMSQFNIATKMSEYLASGVPILAVGPPYSAMIDYLEHNKAAITVASDDENDIRGAFVKLQNLQLVGQVLENAQKLVEQQVGSNSMHVAWRTVMEGLPAFK